MEYGVDGYYDPSDDSPYEEIDPYLYYIKYIPKDDKYKDEALYQWTDGYDHVYEYDFGYIMTRYCDFKETDLFRIMNKYCIDDYTEFRRK